jgi:hypothetical protein
MADSILTRWDISLKELTAAVDSNPSLRGMLFGYVAETVLLKTWFSDKRITFSIKYDDHDRKKKGDRVLTYRGYSFIVESKSLQTNSIVRGRGVWRGNAQCDASDRRKITLPDGSQLNTTCLLTGDFDLLAVNCFAFENEWRFVFAKNDELPRSRFRGYTDAQRRYLLASLMPVTWPPQPPFYDEPFRLLDEIIEDRKRKGIKPMVVTGADQIELSY